MTMNKDRTTRRKEILDAAMRCYSKKGYHATTMDDITRESGLTKGGIYWHFKSKWEIFLEMIREHKKVHLALWEKIEKMGAGADALIQGGLLFLREHITTEWLANVRNEVEIEATRNKEVRQEYISLYDEIKDKVEEILKQAHEQGVIRALDFESVAVVIVSLVEGILTQYWLSGRTLDYERVWRSFCDSFLAGALER
jgi:AcrR family transcriptional regulator